MASTSAPSASSRLSHRERLLAEVDLAALRLSVAVLPFLVFVVGGPIQYRLVKVSWAAAGGAGRAGCRGRRECPLQPRPFVAATGGAFLLAALLQLAQVGRSSNWLGGDGSTFALFLAFGVGLVVLGTAAWWAPKPAPSIPTSDGGL